jgi:hypothetical protein
VSPAEGTRIGELWQRGQLGWPRRYPIVQAPNAPLLVALAGWALAAVDGGWPGGVGRLALALGLGVWAAEEVVAGANLFRRLLGAGMLTWLGLRLTGLS